MDDFEGRERALENKYAMDQDRLFNIHAKACKLLGLWAAQEIGLSSEAAMDYADEVIVGNVREPALSDVITKVSADLTAKGKTADSVPVMLSRFLKDAEDQLSSAAQ